MQIEKWNFFHIKTRIQEHYFFVWWRISLICSSYFHIKVNFKRLKREKYWRICVILKKMLFLKKCLWSMWFGRNWTFSLGFGKFKNCNTFKKINENLRIISSFNFRTFFHVGWCRFELSSLSYFTFKQHMAKTFLHLH